MAAASSLSVEQYDQQLSAHKWMVALAVMLGTTLVVIDSSIINVALPYMQGTFSATVDEISMVVTSYLVSNSIMIPMTGWISGRFGRKRYFLLSVVVFVAASALCGVSTSLDEIVIFRLIQGAAGAAMIPSSQAILTETFPPNERQMAMAMWGIGLMVAPILGPTLGGWITDNLNWRWNFYVNVPVGILATLMVIWFVQDPPYLRRESGGKVDYLGIVFLTLGVGLLQIIADRGQRADWFASNWVIYSSLIAAFCIIALPIQELRVSDPILDPRPFRITEFTACVVLGTVLNFALFGTNLLRPVFLQEFMGYSAWWAGWTMAPSGLGSMAAMLVVGQVARRNIDTRWLIALGFVLMGYGMWEMAAWNMQVSMWEVIWPGILLGAGTGLIFPILSAVALSCVEREEVGNASSLYNSVRFEGSAIGVSYMTTALVSHEQIHQSHMVGHYSVFSAWRMAKAAPRMPSLMTGGLHPSLRMRSGFVYGEILKQSAMLSFNDIYRTLAIVLFLMIPSFLAFKPTHGTPPPGVMME